MSKRSAWCRRGDALQVKRFHFSEYAIYGYSEMPILTLLELESPLPTTPVCVDLLAEWPQDGEGGVVSSTCCAAARAPNRQAGAHRWRFKTSVSLLGRFQNITVVVLGRHSRHQIR